MKIIDVKGGPLALESLLLALAEEDVLLTKDGHVRARVESFDDGDLEDWLFEHDPKAIQAAEAARERRKRGEGIPLAILREELEA